MGRKHDPGSGEIKMERWACCVVSEFRFGPVGRDYEEPMTDSM